ncbi:hypothetical protein A9306_10010 [Moraxella atlantae]|uniref:Uncharacterized protein n=2 Tax=Faucicola atlantae TaxID=34059 RepID=A0A1B8QB53_9GAMM|nr:hypothetical protein A9306_10010 [Moraxella atlantae]
MNYDGKGVNIGLGAGINPTTQKMSPPGISGIGYGRDGDSQTSTTYGAVTGMAGKSEVTTANVGTLNETLANSFDKDRVNAQINAQVSVTQAFDTERRSYRLEMAQKEQELRDKAKEAQKRGDMATHDDLIAKADKQQHDMVLFDSITGAIYGPNTNGVTGYVARAVAPEVSYQIGQYFKGTHSEGSAPHILAHGILAAAVSAATGNDVTTGALSAMGAEAAAPMVVKFLFGDKPISELSADEKATVSSITSLAGLGVGATTGDVASAVSAGETAKVAVEDNNVVKSQFWKIEKFIRIAPSDAKLYSYQGTGFYAPPFANFAEVYNAGAKNAKENLIVTDRSSTYISAGMVNGVEVGKAIAFYNTMDNDVGHLGRFDYQRNYEKHEFIPPYTDAANFAVGVYLAGTGLPYEQAMKLPTQFANMFSSNAGTPAQRKFWDLGWRAAKSGALGNLEVSK